MSKVVEKIAAWPAEQRITGERLHAIVLGAVPELRPKLHYGQPGYARSGRCSCPSATATG